MIGDLNIALAQVNPVVGDLDGNVQKIMEYWAKADQQNADLVIFPELVLCGYPPQDLVLRPGFLDAVDSALQTLIEHSKSFNAAALIGAPVKSDVDTPYNGMHLIENGTIQTRYKYHLPNYGVFDEKRVFKSGPLPEAFDFRGHKLGVMICEDMWFPDVSAHLKQQGAEILIAPHASPFAMDKHDVRLEHARKRATENDLPFILCNLMGGQDDLVFDGGAFYMDAAGDVLNHAPFFEEHLMFLNSDYTLEQDLQNITYTALKTGIRDYVHKNGFSGVLIGLSGGIDSALAAILAVDALGAENVTCIMMPSKYTSQDSLDDAQELAKNLGVELLNIPINGVVETLNQTLSDDAPSIAFENIQSRARGVILMAQSNASGKMVLTTGNKSEMAVGYATLYGDMCGGFNVLKDVYKTQVYPLSEWRNKHAGSDLIPSRIITKAPTAELKENQTDQDSLPPYDILDEILKGYIEDDLSITDMLAKGFDEDTCKRVWQLLHRAEYKRRQAAPGAKITTRALYGDWRYPMTNKFKGL